MPDQDHAEDKALAAAHSISTEVGRLWMEAYADGMRNGIEVAAQYLDGLVDVARESEMPAEFMDLVTGVRDTVRLMSLQVPDPEVPGGKH